MEDLDNDSDFFLSESSEDDDLEFLTNTWVKKNENYLDEIVPQYDEHVFFTHFRLSRAIAYDIALKYEASDQYKPHSGQYGKISAFHQILIFLWYIGHQTSSFRDVADRFDITISSLHRIIARVTTYLSNLSPQIIVWPRENEKVVAAEHFRVNGFPGIIGAIDGCHVKIDKPKNDPDSYLNRKGYYSIQMQAVCDHQKKIIDLFVGYPGSVHDSRVFTNSPLCNDLENKCGNYHLLGDRGYPLKKNLLTPFKDRGQLTPTQINYNIKLSKNRYKIEHCFGIMKQKFRQLYHVKLRNITYIVHLIRAACVLHNISINDAFNIDEEDVAILENNQLPVAQELYLEDEEDDMDARRNRDNIANNLDI